MELLLLNSLNKDAKKKSIYVTQSGKIGLIAHNSTSVQEIVQTCGLSDNYIQITTLQYPTVKTVPRAYFIRSFQQCDWNQLRNVLSSTPWNVMSIFDDINDKWCIVHTLLQDCLSSFLLLKSEKSKRPTPWFTLEIANKSKLKNKAKRIFEKTQLESDRARFKSLKNNLKSTICQAKIDYLKSSLSQVRSSLRMTAQMWC